MELVHVYFKAFITGIYKIYRIFNSRKLLLILQKHSNIALANFIYTCGRYKYVHINHIDFSCLSIPIFFDSRPSYSGFDLTLT